MEKEQSQLDSEDGKLQERLNTFSQEEKGLQGSLDLFWNRNLLGELDPAAQARNEAAGALLSIRNHYLHSSPELAAALNELDILYETGESYLRNQPPDLRRTLLGDNPLLPYAFIMPKADMERLTQLNPDLILRRIIPLMAYEDLNTVIENQGRLARLQPEILLTCFYKGRIFDNDHLNTLIEEMETREKEAAGRYEHYLQTQQTAAVDHAACRGFTYPADFQYQLEKSIKTAEDTLFDLDQEQEENIAARKQGLQRLEQLEQKLPAIIRQIPPAENSLQVFLDFLLKEPEYQYGRKRLDKVRQDAQNLTRQKEDLQQNLEKLKDRIDNDRIHISRQSKMAEGLKHKVQIYQGAGPASLLEGSIDELENRLSAIKAEYSQDIIDLEQQQKDKSIHREKIRKQLEKLGVPAEDHAAVSFAETDLDNVQTKILHLEAELKNRQAEKEQASRDEAAAAAVLTHAREEVRRLGAGEPLPAHEIKGDFAPRRARLQEQTEKLENQNNSIDRQLSRHVRARENIEQTVETAVIEPARDFVPEPDAAAQADRLEKDFRSRESANRDKAGSLRNSYDNCKINFKDKNQTLDNIFKGIDPLWDKDRLNYEDHYYLFERMSQHGEKLSELIAVYESQLANLERSIKDMVQQSSLQGRRLYEEIQAISEHSKVRLPGRSRPVQMLKIDLPLDDH